MRIVIDLQGAQSSGSENRGIGHYTMSWVDALIRNRGNHEIFLLLNGAFLKSVERIFYDFKDIISNKNILVWHPLSQSGFIEKNKSRRQCSELIREAFIYNLNPDVVVCSSLFEGLVDDAVCSIKYFSREYLTAVILYDLIPFLYPKLYLENLEVKEWYLEKIEHLRRADLLLAISKSSAREGVTNLNLDPERCINISTDVNVNFRPVKISSEIKLAICKKYHGLKPDFIMYTGGIDHRKNIEGLIRAYALLPSKVRTKSQLVIVCNIQDVTRIQLFELAISKGLHNDEIIFTGFIPEEDLIVLYNLCRLFVFPSWHEGFGLPVLEAMRCRAPVIGSNASSIPEIIGMKAALFDPKSDVAIKNAIYLGLTNKSFRSKLIKNGITQAAKFSWDKTAKRSIKVIENLFEGRKQRKNLSFLKWQRIKLAYISPLPPARSGIADYSADLLPYLSRFYDIDVIYDGAVSDLRVTKNCKIRSHQWFLNHAETYERVLYQFGNSEFHQHMFDLLKIHPGVVCLHDFYLSGVLNYIKKENLIHALYYSHGYFAIKDLFESQDLESIIYKYPCNLEVLHNALGIIFHSSYSVSLISKWYGDLHSKYSNIPLLREVKLKALKSNVRKAIGMNLNDFLVCSFGGLAPTKQNHRLLDAWFKSSLAEKEECHLVFVGENHAGSYGDELLTKIKQHKFGRNVHITGWADANVYQNYLAAADLGVQLRTLSRGETSGAILDCMSYGVPSIINANGSMAELADDGVWMLPDDFIDSQLIEALEKLWKDQDLRRKIGSKAKNSILKKHNPKKCAEKYRDSIEEFYQIPRASPSSFIVRKISEICDLNSGNDNLKNMAQRISQNFPSRPHKLQILIDVTSKLRNVEDIKMPLDLNTLRGYLLRPLNSCRVEPIYLTDNGFKYARKFAIELIGCHKVDLVDEIIDFSAGDFFIQENENDISDQVSFIDDFKKFGVNIINTNSLEGLLEMLDEIL
jgi:glycosyltransferase involved in cell wall biosynthesis